MTEHSSTCSKIFLQQFLQQSPILKSLNINTWNIFAIAYYVLQNLCRINIFWQWEGHVYFLVTRLITIWIVFQLLAEGGLQLNLLNVFIVSAGPFYSLDCLIITVFYLLLGSKNLNFCFRNSKEEIIWAFYWSQQYKQKVNSLLLCCLYFETICCCLENCSHRTSLLPTPLQKIRRTSRAAWLHFILESPS